MYFIEVTGIDGEKLTINAEKISVIFKNQDNGTTRILLDYEVFDDYAYEDVKESISEIIAMCEYKPN